MCTPAKSAAARRNGAKSLGPVTPEGKARSSRNALTHGLAASHVTLMNEQEPLLQSMLQGYIEEWQPQNVTERDLVEQMVVAKWRHRRMLGIESALLDVEMVTEMEEFARQYPNEFRTDLHQALAFEALAERRAIPLLLRYDAALSRQYESAMKRLLELRSVNALPAVLEAADPEIQNEPTEDLTPELLTSPEDPTTPQTPSPDTLVSQGLPPHGLTS